MMDSSDTCMRTRSFSFGLFFIYFVSVLFFFLSPCVFCRVTINFCPLQQIVFFLSFTLIGYVKRLDHEEDGEMLVFILSLVAAIQIKFLKNVSGFQINLFQ